MELGRRELATRRQQWPRKVAHFLAERGVTPNSVSVSSMLAAAFAGIAWYLSSVSDGVAAVALAAGGVVFVQIRLLCNLLDGLIAVEEKIQSRAGDLFNDAPDRVCDALILMASGLLCHFQQLGLVAALLAVWTAYARVLGTALTRMADYDGPMAKQHRMFVVSVGGIGVGIESWFGDESWSMDVALIVICIGSIVTILRRHWVTYRQLTRAL